MSVNSNNGHIDDEDTQEEVDLSDTERPPNSRDRDTAPDLSLEAAIAMRSLVVEIKDLTGLPREEEIIARICADVGLKREHLKNLRKAEAGGRLTLLECRPEGTSISYIYMTADHAKSDFVGEGHVRFPLQHPGATVLLRVYMDGTSKEVYRWQEEKKS